MASGQDDLLNEVAGYYTGKLAVHGETPRGVDWNGEEGQFLRFAQLERVLPEGGAFSLNDLGCGYGALLDFLGSRHPGLSYAGIDVSAAMVEAARKRHAGRPGVRFVASARPDAPADYGVASGIFNVRLGRGDEEWGQHVEATLDVLHATSTRGFAFNCLTAYSDPPRMRPDLYYADPCRLFDLCKRRYARDVALLHDYGLYEFTILVRKAP